MSIAILRRGSTWSLLGLLSAVTLVVLLALQLRTLRRDYATLQERERTPVEGTYLPRLDLELVNGGRAAIGAPPPGGRQVLFVYTTTCGFCLRSLSAWQEVARRVRDLPVEVYGVSLDSVEITRRYAHDHQLTFPAALLLDPRSRALMHAGAVPQTVVIDAEGRVLHSRLGTLTDAGADSVVALLEHWQSVGGGIQ